MFKYAFSQLADQNKHDLTNAVRWFTWHFDGYLNAMYRKIPYPIKKIRRHRKELDHAAWSDTFNDYDNSWCNNIESPYSPIEDFKEMHSREECKTLTEADYENFINKTISICLFIHKTFSDLAFPLPVSVEVWRGLLIKKGKTPQMDLIGITSVSTNYNSALNFAFADYESYLYDEREFDSYMIGFTLPPGCLVIPGNICTIQNEHELIVMTQGILEHYEVASKVTTPWNRYINSSGRTVPPLPEAVWYYIEIKCNFIPGAAKPELGGLTLN